MGGLRRAGVVFVLATLAWSAAGTASAAPREWRKVASPSVAPHDHANVLLGVACAGTDWCVAVGDQHDVPFSQQHTIIEQWNGTTWSTAAPADTGTLDQLRGVTCLTDTDCTAVGATGGSTLVEHWNGDSWIVVPSPNDQSDDLLEAVACSSATSCIAAGYAIDGNEPTALLEQWDGAHWTLVPSLTPGVTSRLNGAACPSPTLCFAVGSTTRGAARTVTLIEKWNGASWSIVKSVNEPETPGQSIDVLNGVACFSPTACLAVGGYEVNSTSTAIAERWNGERWRLAATPAVPSGATFGGVDCAGSYCAAVGDSGSGPNGSSTLVETTRGHAFTVVPSADPGSGYNFVQGVSCTDLGACTAVGEWANQIAPPWEKTLVLSP